MESIPSPLRRFLNLRDFSKEDAEKAGYDCGKNGPSSTNCHFRLFATPELTKAWERGKARADKERLESVAVALGCEAEWSNQHSHADCIQTLIEAANQRIEALEQLLACYRLGKRPSEALLTGANEPSSDPDEGRRPLT
jgi:hypothetical protein